MERLRTTTSVPLEPTFLPAPTANDMMIHAVDTVAERAIPSVHSNPSNQGKRKRGAAAPPSQATKAPSSPSHAAAKEAESELYDHDEGVARPLAKKRRPLPEPADDDADEVMQSIKIDPTAEALPKVKSKAAPISDRHFDSDPTSEVVEKFTNGLNDIKNRQDWSSTTLEKHMVDVIRWYDGEDKSFSDCAVKYVNEGYARRGTCSLQYMDRKYKEWAKVFYEEKGLVFVSPSQRQKKKKTLTDNAIPEKKPGKLRKPKATADAAGREPEEEMLLEPMQDLKDTDSMRRAPQRKVGATSKPTVVSGSPFIMPQENETLSERRPSIINKQLLNDELALKEAKKLQERFSKSGASKQLLLNFGAKRNIPTPLKLAPELEVLQNDIDRFNANRLDDKVLSFKRKAGDAARGHPSRPILSYEAVRYSAFLSDALRLDPQVDTVAYEDGIEDATVHRLIACISPEPRASLPTHDLIEVIDGSGRSIQATQIQWTMEELQNLYMFALCMKTPYVHDLIKDRLHEDLHRSTLRVMRNEFDELKEFDILNFEPAFVNSLADYDAKGFDFVTDVLIMKGERGWNMLNAYGLNNYDEVVKKTLLEKMEAGATTPVATKDLELLCQVYHHHHEDGHACYKSIPLATPASTEPSVPEDLSSRKVVSPRVHNKSAQDSDRWALQQEFQKKEQARNMKRKRASRDDDNGDEEERIHKKLKERYGDDNEQSYYVEDSGSDEEDANSITIGLPEEYTDTRRMTKLLAENDEEELIPYDNSPARNTGEDRITYPGGKGMNGTKDSEDIALKKFRLVKAALRKYHNAGYDVWNKKFAPPDDADHREDLNDEDEDDSDDVDHDQDSEDDDAEDSDEE